MVDWASIGIGAGAVLFALLLLAVGMGIVERRNTSRYAMRNGWRKRSEGYEKMWSGLGSATAKGGGGVRGACSIYTNRWETINLDGFASQLDAMKFADWCMGRLPLGSQEEPLTEETILASRATWAVARRQ